MIGRWGGDQGDSNVGGDQGDSKVERGKVVVKWGGDQDNSKVGWRPG